MLYSNTLKQFWLLMLGALRARIGPYWATVCSRHGCVSFLSMFVGGLSLATKPRFRSSDHVKDEPWSSQLWNTHAQTHTMSLMYSCGLGARMRVEL